MPPVKPILPSTTTTLRWVRRFNHGRLNGLSSWDGWNQAVSTPAARSVRKLRRVIADEPTASISRRTLTPARARSISASQIAVPLWSGWKM